MALIRNLTVRLGINFDDSGVSRFTRGLDRCSGGLSKLGTHMEKLKTPALVGSLVAGAGAATSFATAIVPAAGAMLAMPAAMALTKAATATLKVGIAGLGDAMGAVVAGDSKKLNKALKELSPNAREFVKSTAGLLQNFEPIKKAVQDKLFDGLGKGIEPLSKNLLPSLSKGMQATASGMNLSAKEAIKFGSTPIAKGALSAVFKTTSSVLKEASGAVQPLLKGVSALVIAGLPLIKRFASWAIGGAKTAGAFLSSERGATALKNVVQNAGDTLAQLGRIGRNVGTFLVTLFKGASSDSADFLGTLEKMTDKLASWSASSQGSQQVAETFYLLGDTARSLAAILPYLVGPLGAIAKLLTTMPPDVQGVVSKVLAFSVVAGLLASKLTGVASGVVSATSKLIQFGGGLVRGSAALSGNATFAAKAGAAVRTFGGWMVSGGKAILSTTIRLGSQAIAWGITTTATIASTVAQKAATVASKALAIGIRLVNLAMRANPIGIIITLLLAFGAGLVVLYKKNETFRKIVDAVWKWVKNVIGTAWSNIKLWFAALVRFITITIPSAWNTFKSNISATWKNVTSFISAGWTSVKTLLTKLKDFVTVTIPNAFKTGVSAIGRAWDKVKEVAKTPVKFVVNTVYNQGIARIWNWIADKTGLGRLPLITGFAKGGVLPGYSQKDNQLIAARSGESIFVPEFTKAVGPDWVHGMNHVARHGGPRAVVKAMTGEGMGIPAFENGGIVGAVSGFFAKAKEFFVNGFIKAAKAALSPILNVAKNAMGGTPLGSMLSTAVSKIVDGALNAFKPFESELGGGGATGVVKAAAKYIGQGDRNGRDNDNTFNDRWGFGVGTPWCANFVSTAIADAKAGKKYAGFPSASVYGYWSRMNKVALQNARPGDLGVHGGPSSHINLVSKKLGGNSYETIGGNEGPVVRRSTRTSAYAILRPAFARGGIFDKKIFQQRNEDPADRRNPMRMFMAGELKPFKYDNGGILQPGQVGANYTREPEYIFTKRQTRDMANGSRGETININVNVPPTADKAAVGKAVYEALLEYKRRNRRVNV